MAEFAGGNPRYGKKNPLSQDMMPAERAFTFRDFTGGYDSSKARSDTAQNSTPNSLDMECDRKNRIVRSAGTSLVETVDEDHVVTQLITHASLDNRSELLQIAAPWLGIKTDEETAWYNLGLDATRQYSWSNFGGTLILSNGEGDVWARQPGEATLVSLPQAPLARSYESFAGRVWALNIELDGQLEPLGVAWSAANSDYSDWTGTGSGFELLINEMSAGDRGVALRAMGLDFMAVMLRKSIWIARRTQLTDRPGDLQPRVAGIGPVNERVCRTTRFGVLFLSDTGVYVFDGNNCEMISAQINADILPLDYANVDQYYATYDPILKRYHLQTPTKLWTFDMEPKRWIPRSIVATDAALFADQFDQVTWAEITGTWADQTDRWSDLSPQEGESFVVFLGESGGAQVIEEEDATSEFVFSVATSPFWEFPQIDAGIANHLFTIKGFFVKYQASGTLKIWANDKEADLEILVEQLLPNTAPVRLVYLPVIDTGLGVGVKMGLGTGQMKISQFQVVTVDRGPRIETQDFTPREYYPDFG